VGGRLGGKGRLTCAVCIGGERSGYGSNGEKKKDVHNYFGGEKVAIQKSPLVVVVKVRIGFGSWGGGMRGVRHQKKVCYPICEEGKIKDLANWSEKFG